VRVERLAHAEQFLATTADFRRADPVMTNLLGSVATSVAAGREYAPQFWWVVRDDGGQVVGCALRTGPHRLVVSPMPTQAAAALAVDVAAADADLPGFSGPRDAVEAVAASMAPRRRIQVTMTDVVYVLGEYVRPRPTPGASRRARRSDLDLLVAWHEQFGLDAQVPMHDTRASVLDRLEQAGLWLWEVQGRAVAMAGHAPLVQMPGAWVARIGPVYTPAASRRSGYGSAVTASVVEELLPTCATIMLFADAANPASNSVYRALGFRAAGELVEAAVVRADRAEAPSVALDGTAT